MIDTSVLFHTLLRLSDIVGSAKGAVLLLTPWEGGSLQKEKVFFFLLL